MTDRPVQAWHRAIIMLIFRILKVLIAKINKPSSLWGGKETKQLAPGILHPASDYLSTENKLFLNKSSFQACHNSPASRFKKILHAFKPPYALWWKSYTLHDIDWAWSQTSFQTLFWDLSFMQYQGSRQEPPECKPARSKAGLSPFIQAQT